MKRNFFVVDQDNEETHDPADIGFDLESPPADDALLEYNLILLFSEMDQQLAALNHKKDKHPYAVIAVLLQMLNECAEYSESVLKIDPEREFLSNLANVASDSFSHLRLLHVKQNRMSDATALNLYKGWTGERVERHRVFKEISSGMEQILKSYLSFFSSGFADPDFTDQWNDICEVFTEDLNKSLQSVSF